MAMRPQGRGLVLVVDDSVTMRQLLTALLKQQGFDVSNAEDGIEAIERFDADQPDLVLMDLMMPRMGGCEAALEIKRRAGDRYVPILFLTGVSDENALAECLGSAGDDVLSKPVSPTMLRARLQVYERTRQLVQTLRSQQELAIREQEIAQSVFDRAVRSHNASLPGCTAVLRPAGRFSGDLILTATSPTGDEYALVADLTGHGLSGALASMPLAQVFRAMVAKDLSITTMVQELNNTARAILPTGMFFAAVLVVIEPYRRQIEIWNGGMPDVLRLDHSGNLKTRLPSDSLPLGVVPFTGKLPVTTLSLDAGDQLFVYSDGLIEAENSHGMAFGEKRLLQVLSAAVASNAQEPERSAEDRSARSVQQALETLEGFLGTTPAEDDIALFCIATEVVDPTHQRQTAIRRPLSRLIEDSPERHQWHWLLRNVYLPESLRRLDLVPGIVNAIPGLSAGSQEDRANVYLILTELLNNAVDHGLLGLDSRLKSSQHGFSEYFRERTERLTRIEKGKIKLSVRISWLQEHTRMHLRIEDPGPGFEHAGLLELLDRIEAEAESAPVEAELAATSALNLGESAYAGRGVRLLRQLCADLRYLGRGNVVEASYTFRGVLPRQV